MDIEDQIERDIKEMEDRIFVKLESFYDRLPDRFKNENKLLVILAPMQYLASLSNAMQRIADPKSDRVMGYDDVCRLVKDGKFAMRYKNASICMGSEWQFVAFMPLSICPTDVVRDHYTNYPKSCAAL